MAAVPAGDIAEKKKVLSRLRFLLHGLIVLTPVLGLIGYQAETGFRAAHLEWIFGLMAAAYVLWPGYLFRRLDRALADRLSASRFKMPLRAR